MRRDDSGRFGVRLNPDAGTLTLERRDGPSVADSAIIFLRPWLEATVESRPEAPFAMPAALMAVDGSGALMDVRVLLLEFEGRRVGDSTVVDSVTPEFLVRTAHDGVSGEP